MQGFEIEFTREQVKGPAKKTTRSRETDKGRDNKTWKDLVKKKRQGTWQE